MLTSDLRGKVFDEHDLLTPKALGELRKVPAATNDLRSRLSRVELLCGDESDVVAAARHATRNLDRIEKQALRARRCPMRIKLGRCTKLPRKDAQHSSVQLRASSSQATFGPHRRGVRLRPFARPPALVAEDGGKDSRIRSGNEPERASAPSV